ACCIVSTKTPRVCVPPCSSLAIPSGRCEVVIEVTTRTLALTADGRLVVEVNLLPAAELTIRLPFDCYGLLGRGTVRRLLRVRLFAERLVERRDFVLRRQAGAPLVRVGIAGDRGAAGAGRGGVLRARVIPAAHAVGRSERRREAEAKPDGADGVVHG